MIARLAQRTPSTAETTSSARLRPACAIHHRAHEIPVSRCRQSRSSVPPAHLASRQASAIDRQGFPSASRSVPMPVNARTQRPVPLPICPPGRSHHTTDVGRANRTSAATIIKGIFRIGRAPYPANFPLWMPRATNRHRPRAAAAKRFRERITGHQHAYASILLWQRSGHRHSNGRVEL